MTDPKGRPQPGYERHVFICGHERPPDAARPCCAGRDSLAVLKQMKAGAREAGLTGVRVQKSGCLDFCENGISCVVYPEGVWYRIADPERDVPEIVERHLRHGEVVERCLMKF